MNIELVAEGLEFPEGPIALANGDVIVCEIAAERITRISPDGSKRVLGQVPGGPNGLALGPDGQIYICNNGGGFGFEKRDGITRPSKAPTNYTGGRIEKLDPETGTLTELYRKVGDHDLLMPNDIVFDSNGGFYFTDFGRHVQRGLKYGGLYYGKADGSLVTELVHGLNTPNGVGLSPDEDRVYTASTDTGRVMGFDVLAPGETTQPRPATMAQFVHSHIAGYRRYDSLAVEANGNICIASLNPGNITVVSPTGEHVETVPMPDPLPTNIAFGGTDMQTAFVTLSGAGQLVKMRWPRPGLRLNHQDSIS